MASHDSFVSDLKKEKVVLVQRGERHTDIFAPMSHYDYPTELLFYQCKE